MGRGEVEGADEDPQIHAQSQPFLQYAYALEIKKESRGGGGLAPIDDTLNPRATV